MQTGIQSAETRTLHVVKIAAGSTIGVLLLTRPMMALHVSVAKPLQGGTQAARQSSWMSAIAGEPMDNRRTSAMQAATGTATFRGAAVPLAEAIDQQDSINVADVVPLEKEGRTK
jgi:hypothetical protein